MAEKVKQEDTLPHDKNAWFFKATSLEELLAGATPLQSIDNLAIDDLTPEEAESFLRAVKE